MNRTAPLSDFPLEKIHEANRQAKILFASMGSSLVAYLIVSRLLPETQPVAGADMLRIALLIAAGAVVFAATVVKGIMLRNAPPSPEARLARLRSTAVMSAAFAELPAVLGFVSVFLAGPSMAFYGLLVVSAYMLARHFPTRDAWELYVRRGDDAR
jgi:hypothetical protein